MNILPHGVMRMAWAILDETFGTLKKCDAMSVEKPICEIEKPGRYREHSGRNLAAQHPSTMRLLHGLDGAAGTLLIVSPIKRITSSASLSSCIVSRQQVLVQLG